MAGVATGLVVDEIGKMECFSSVFVETMRQILDGDTPLLATIAMRVGGFIRDAKDRENVDVITVTRGNRDRLPLDLVARFVAH